MNELVPKVKGLGRQQGSPRRGPRACENEDANLSANLWRSMSELDSKVKMPPVGAGGRTKEDIVSDGVTFNTTFVERECKKCGHIGQPMDSGEVNEIHGHKLLCPHCGSFVAWGGREKPIKSTDGERAFSTQWTPKRLGVEECQLCRREKSFVESGGEKLESHHLRSIKDGGEDKPYNILIVCTPCHRVIHHNQTYYGHMRAFYEAWAASRKKGHDGDSPPGTPLLMRVPPFDPKNLGWSANEMV